MTVRRARAVIIATIAAIAKKTEKAKSKTYTILKCRAEALPQTVEKVKQKCLAFSLICGIINMVMKCAENRKIRTTSDRICMYGLAC